MPPKMSHKLTIVERLARLVWVLAFDELADNYWPERVLWEPLGGARCIIVTHHLDLHDGDLEEALGLRSVGPRGGIGKVYGRLRRTDMDEFERRRLELLRAARECAEQIRAEEGLPAPGDGGPMFLGDAAAGDPAGTGLPPLPAPAGPPAFGAGDSGDAFRNWEVTEARDGYEIDDLISRVRAKVGFGDRGVPELSDGGSLAVALTGTTSRPTPRDHDDIRTLAVKVDSLGDRSRPFPGAVNAMQLMSVEGWPIVGLRTCLWLLMQFVKLNFTPMQRYHWWRQILGLSVEDAEVCPPSLVFFEMVCWRCQLWEEVKEAAILKERREGREEKLLAAGAGPARAASPALHAYTGVQEGANPSGQPKPMKKPKKPKTAPKGAEGTGYAPHFSGEAPVDYPVLQFCVKDIVDSSHDLLPIPLAVGLDSVLYGSGPLGLSPAAQRRSAKRDRQNRWLRDGLRSLSALGGQGRRVATDAALTEAQRVAVRRLAGLYGSVSFPDSHRDTYASWKALQGLRPGYAESESEGGRAVDQPGMISLPCGGAGRVDTGSIAPGPLLKMLGAGRGVLREPAEVQSLFESRNGNLRYLDPKLARRGCDFGRSLSGLSDAGVVEVDPGNVLDEIGLLFVRRKDHKLRLIANARAANLHFVEPACAELAGPGALAAIECDGPDMIGFCSGGVEACFYRYELPERARRYFTLPAIKAQCLLAALRGRLGLARDTSELKSQVQVLYIDNFAVASVDRVRAEGAAKVMREALAELGVASAIEACDGSKAELLGKPKRFWRLRGALDYLLEAKCREVTGHEVERVLGHIMAACMLRRESLAAFSACYTFAETSGLKRQPLWPSARRELFWARSLLPCVVGEMGKAWSSTVTAYDASPWGFGVVETEWEPAAVASRGRLSERARFRGPLAAAGAPRDRTVEAEVAQAPDAALILTGRASEFPEVSARALAEATWRVVGCGRRGGARPLVGISRLGSRTSVGAGGSVTDPAVHLEFRLRPSRRGGQSIPLGAPSDPRLGQRSEGAHLGALGLWSAAAGFAAQARADRAARRRGGAAPGRGERQLVCPRLPRLAAEKVRLNARAIYLGVLKAWLAWLPLGCLPDWTREDWGCTLVEFVEWLFDKGGAAATAKRVGPALLWGDPRLALGSLRTTFPVLQQALKGRVQRRPEFSRPLLPRVVVAAGARELLDLNMCMAALGVMIMFETYMCPAKLLALLTEHVALLPGEAGAARWLTFVIRAQEALVPSKTNAFDISVPLDLGRQCWLARCLEVAVRSRGPGSSLLGLVRADFAAAFKTVLKGVGASVLRGALYSLRHGGASHDRSMGARSVAAAQQRGGWRAFRGVARYEKRGRLGLEPQKLGPARLALPRQRSAGTELAFERYFGLR
ncbi:unnamed protein product, partial [Prorocentrum cordatum]